MTDKQKVFAIGFHRTGTTTFQTALEELGYRVVGMRDAEWYQYEQGRWEDMASTIAEFDAFRDMPWPLMYRWLHQKYPTAKFVMTYRDVESWLKSCAGNYKDRPYTMFQTIYGFSSFVGNEERAKQIYLSHIDNTRRYFRDFPNQFLEVDLTMCNDWSPLCNFLDEDIPDRSFPHANKRPLTAFQKIVMATLRLIFPSTYLKYVRDK